MRRDLIGETLLNQFRVQNYLASGGMATIYRVWDMQRNVPLAMKVLHPELGEDPAFIARFQREARSLQMLVHPNIVPFYGLYRDDGLTFMLERYIDGPSLDEVLRSRAGRPMSIAEALVYYKALYTSLGYAHAQGIIHCDVKPGNVLIDQGGHVYLTDFGIARYMDAAVTTSSALGTPLYMAPEQIRGERVTPQTDIYSLGVLMYELLTGQRPFRGDVGVPDGVGDNQSDRIRYQHLYVAPTDPRALNPAIPEPLAQVILKAMAKNPGDRYPTVQAMADEISRAVAARFETLPDRVRLPENLRARELDWTSPAPEKAPDAAQPNGVVIPPGGDGWAPYPQEAQNGQDTLPGAPPASPGAAPRPAPGRPAVNRPAGRGLHLPRWLLPLLGALVLLAICGVIGAQVMRGINIAGPHLPVGLSPTKAADEKTPGAKPTPTGAAQGLSNFPVNGEIVITQRAGGVDRLALLNAGTGGQTTLPNVPNVNVGAANAAQWSPDGQRLTWVSQYNGRLHISAMNMSEMEPYQLPAAEAYGRVSSPAFLPDGKSISFWASGSGAYYMITADATSGVESVKTQMPGFRSMFVWNWRSNLIAFIQQGANNYKVAVSDTADGPARVIDTGGEGYAPAWSNDGQWIAFQSDLGRDPGIDEIWIAHADGSDLHAVTKTPEGFWSRAPAWSPDGKMIAFVSNRSGSLRNDYGELFVVDLATGKVRQLTNTGGQVYDWRPAWRP